MLHLSERDTIHRNDTMSVRGSEQLDWLISRSKRQDIRIAPRSSSLSRSGDKGKRVRVILSGWAFRFHQLNDGRRQILEVLLPGDTFGLETLFGGMNDTSIQTSTAITYVALNSEDLSDAFDTSADFRAGVMRLLSEHRVVLQEMVVGLGKYNAEERTSILLRDLHTRLVACGLSTDQSYLLELTQNELSDMLGLHLIHLNRVLARLRQRNLLSLEKRRVTLLDLEGLAEMTPWIAHSRHAGP